MAASGGDGATDSAGGTGEVSLADWTAVGAIATAVLAVATFMAVRQGQKERSQIVINRELTWRPALSGGRFNLIGSRFLGPSEPSKAPYLDNAGGGPAIGARVLIWQRVKRNKDDPGTVEWRLSMPQDVPASGSTILTGGSECDPEQGQSILDSIGNSQVLAGAISARTSSTDFGASPSPTRAEA